MNELEQLKNMTEYPFNNNVKYIPFEGAFNEFSVIVYGKTETAIRWAQRFLEAGFITATEFKSDEIPEVLKPYKFNLRYKSPDLDLRSGDLLNFAVIIAIATGDPERDQIMATLYHDHNFQLIMSETPCRFANIRFPEDKTKIETKPTDNKLTENKSIIKLGIFEDEMNSHTMKSAIKELKENFPDFQFDVINLKPYDAKKYNLNYHFSDGLMTQDHVNISFDRSYNVLYKEDVDLVIANAETIPKFYLPDIDFWPTLVKRNPTDIITLSPKEKHFESMLDWPPGQKVFCLNYVFEEEIHSVLYDYYEGEIEKLPDFERLGSSKKIKEIYEKNPDAVIVTTFNEFVTNTDKSLSYFKAYNLDLGFLSLAPVPLQGFKVGISRKDNPSKALESLKKAAQKKNQEQLQMFMFEGYYKNRLYPYYGKFFDFTFSGGFNKTYDDKFTFDGYALEKHGRYVRCGGEKFDTMEQAGSKMLDFIDNAILCW